MKKLTRKQKLELLRDWQKVYEELDAEYEKLVEVFPMLTCEDGILKAAYSAFDKYTEMLERRLGGEWDWLSYYCYDNDMGKKGLSAGKNKRMKPIKTLEDLLWIIEL